MSNSRQGRRRKLANGVCPRQEAGRRSAAWDESVSCPGLLADWSDPLPRADILAAYEKILESHLTPLNELSVLPFSKEIIRKAIREELAENPDYESRNHLEIAFVQLESFVPPDDYQLVEDFKKLSGIVQKMARSGDPRDLMESWRLVKQISGDRVVRIFEIISDKMRRRLEEARSIGLRSSAR